MSAAPGRLYGNRIAVGAQRRRRLILLAGFCHSPRYQCGHICAAKEAPTLHGFHHEKLSRCPMRECP